MISNEIQTKKKAKIAQLSVRKGVRIKRTFLIFNVFGRPSCNFHHKKGKLLNIVARVHNSTGNLALQVAQGLDLPKARGQMNGHVLVALLKTVVFSDVVKVVTTDDNGSLHLVLDDDATKNATSDGYIAGEGALFVDVITLGSLNFT